MLRQNRSVPARSLRPFLAGAAAAALIGAGVAFVPLATADDPAPPRYLEMGAPVSLADLVERVQPAVVSVSAERKGGDMPAFTYWFGTPPGAEDSPFHEFFKRFQDEMERRGMEAPPRAPRAPAPPAPPRMPRAEAIGSGFVIDKDGTIVTNHHVIDGAERITVTLQGGETFEAKVVGSDKGTDIAVLKIEAERELAFVELGDDSRLRVGDWVIAVGSPFGFGGTVTAGIVSSIGRDIGNGPYTDYLQIDAPINRGNSGGPTFDLQGRVIGMNTAIYSPSGGSVGIGFAVPASTIRDIVADLRATGAVARGWLGVQIQSLTAEMAQALGLESEDGAIVAAVIDGSPAAKAGFKAGDVVLSVDGTNVENSRDLTRRVGALKPGARAAFEVLRDGERQTISVTVERRDETRVAAADPDERAAPAAPETKVAALGLSLKPLTAQTRDLYDLPSDARGVLVSEVMPDSAAASRGLTAGDVIAAVNNTDVGSAEDVEAAIARATEAGRRTVLLLVVSRGGQRFVALPVAQS